MSEEPSEVTTLPQEAAPQEAAPQEAAPQEAAPQEAVQEVEPTHGYCRWCGAYREEADGDWLCGECERYQDAAICPTCGNLARVSLMPAGAVPSPVSPKKGRK